MLLRQYQIPLNEILFFLVFGFGTYLVDYYYLIGQANQITLGITKVDFYIYKKV